MRSASRTAFLALALGLIGCGADPLCDDQAASKGPLIAVIDAEKPGFYFAPDPSGPGVFVSGDVDDAVVGDLIAVRLTQSDAAMVARCGSATGAEVPVVTLPLDFDRFAGRRIRIVQDLTVTDVGRLHLDGSFMVAAGPTPLQPTTVARPGPDAVAVAMTNRQRSLIIDDLSEHPVTDTLIHIDAPVSIKTLPKVGDRFRELEGVLDTREGPRMRLIRPTEVAVRKVRQRFSPPPGNTTVAAFNVQNLFNGDGVGGDFPTERGARSQAEYQRQISKIVATIIGLGWPDIVALSELENDGFGPQSAVADLVNALNQRMRSPVDTYAFVTSPEGRVGSDDIAVGLIYRRDKVETVGSAITLDDGAFADFNRVPLRQRFRMPDQRLLDVVAVHLKSKGCFDAEGADQDQGDGQVCYAPRRTDAARQLAAWRDPDVPMAIAGDFNALRMEDAMVAFEEEGMVVLTDRADGQSYVFRGQAGSLDHIVVTPELLPNVRGVKIWEINTPYSQWLDYRLIGRSPQLASQLFDQTARRGSDHNPIIAGFAF